MYPNKAAAITNWPDDIPIDIAFCSNSVSLAIGPASSLNAVKCVPPRMFLVSSQYTNTTFAFIWELVTEYFWSFCTPVVVNISSVLVFVENVKFFVLSYMACILAGSVYTLKLKCVSFCLEGLFVAT